jgi:hypothetical protein
MVKINFDVFFGAKTHHFGAKMSEITQTQSML